jgi:hypothetical protein
MTDSNILDDNNIKDFGKLSNHSKVFCYQYPIYIDSKSTTSCVDRICIQCVIDHSFTGYFEDAITSIDTLPQLFPALFRDCNGISRKATSKLQEFVN